MGVRRSDVDDDPMAVVWRAPATPAVPYERYRLDQQAMRAFGSSAAAGTLPWAILAGLAQLRASDVPEWAFPMSDALVLFVAAAAAGALVGGAWWPLRRGVPARQAGLEVMVGAYAVLGLGFATTWGAAAAWLGNPRDIVALVMAVGLVGPLCTFPITGWTTAPLAIRTARQIREQAE